MQVLLDSISDETIRCFIGLICAEGGRQPRHVSQTSHALQCCLQPRGKLTHMQTYAHASHGPPHGMVRYIDFLITLCISRGKARRRNQWRICRMVVQEHPELLLHLRLTSDRKVVVHGDPVSIALLPNASQTAWFNMITGRICHSYTTCPSFAA